MKTRFFAALIHESPGASFQSAVEQNRIHRPLRILGTAATPARGPLPKSPAPAACITTNKPAWWRFASVWRRKSVDRLVPGIGSKRFSQHVITGTAAILLLLSIGCKSTTPSPHFEATVSNASELKPVGAKMLVMTNQLDSALLHAPTNLFTLGPGDKLDIELFGETNSLTPTLVGPDGKIYFNLLPGLDVWGLTLGQTRELIQHELARYVRGQPQVNITLRDVQSKRVWLLG